MIFLSATCQALLAFVLAVACASKTRGRASFAGFTDAVVALGRVPRPWAIWAAAGIVALEGVTVPALLVPGWGSAGLSVAAVLLTGFTYVVARAVRDGSAVACRCFGGSGDHAPGRAQLVRNAVLLVAVVVAAPGVPGAGSLSWQGWFAAWLIGAVCAVVVVTGDEVAALLRPSRRAPAPASAAAPTARPHEAI
ncbi:MauE/DoxX family redox-associated membrane protein [Streptomyces sp. NPDC050546]|uniref:MauE/DoxX family redox-associated membrane protein n=1 Tax=Streptomyces sp. NPDC050546 TaxID=3365628 RepID=UPI00379C2464